MNDLETIAACLPQINPAALEYDEWLAVGIAIKQAGGDVAMWAQWSRRDPARFHEKECEKKWNTFRGSANPVGVGSIVKLCRDQGGDLPKREEKPLDWDFVLPADDLKIIHQEWVQPSELPPAPKNWSGLRDFQTYLATLFRAEECVGIVADAYQTEDKRWMPKKGEYNRTAGELLEELSKAPDLGSVIGDWPRECGAWIRFNPLDGNGVSDSNVTAFRYALIESDEISVERQYAIYRELELPIAALVHSGGKSLHAIIKIDAPDFREYQKRVDFLYSVCKKNGLAVDRKNRNPSRLSRLPGATRNGVPQRLVETNLGKASWAEWSEWIAALNDDLPEIESLADYIDHLPPLADCLIDGVLRKGHKMLIAGPSKAGKSFLLLELCIAIAEGGKWLNWQCAQGRVLYVNLELDRASCYNRIANIYQTRGIAPRGAANIDIWNLRGKAMGIDNLAPRLIRRALKQKYVAIVIDPIYKVITGDENAADQMAKFCNQFDKICSELGCAVICCHHHSKGDQMQKRAQDRASGSGVFARDPDTLLDMIEIKIDEQCRASLAAILPPDQAEQATGWCVNGILREFPPFPPRNVFFCYPIHVFDRTGLLKACAVTRESAAAKRSEARNAEISMEIDAMFQETNQNSIDVKDLADRIGVSQSQIYRRLKAAGISFRKGLIFKEKS